MRRTLLASGRSVVLTSRMRRALLLCLLLAPALAGCPMPPPQSQRVVDSARALNLATRFGRMEEAAELTAPPALASFLERRTGWGTRVRVLDVELVGMRMADEHHATLQVDVQWVHESSTELRVTRLSQEWSDREGPWLLQREQRIGGAAGLFGEPLDPASAPARGDRQFETRTIR